MPQHIKIPSLRELTLINLTDLLSEVTRITPEITSYFETVPVVVCEDLLHQLLLEHELESEFKLRMLKLFLRPQIKSVATGVFHPSDYFRVIHVITTQGQSITSLNLSGVWAKDEHFGILKNMLISLPNLQELYIPLIANDAIFHMISKYNRLIRILDVSGESNITHCGIQEFADELEKENIESQIQVLNIGFPGDESTVASDIAILIKCLQKLESLGCYSFVGKALSCVASLEKHAVKTGLKYLHDTHTDLPAINTITEMCSELKSIYLDRPEQGVILCLESLAKLNKLKLCKFECSELDSLLENKHTFTKMELLLGKGSLNISNIAVTCQQLNQFTCWKMDFLRHTENHIFSHLKIIRISMTPISSLCVKYLLTSCPVLQEIYIDEPLDITDIDIKEVFEKDCQDHLEVLWLGDVRNLTIDSVLLVLEKCPVLRSMGDIIGWGVSLEEIDELHQIIFANNLDLTLLQSE